MRSLSLIFIFALIFASCSSSESKQATCKYDKAEVYYVKDPCWRMFGYNTTFKNFMRTRTRDMLYCSFSLSDRDSLNYISEHILRADKVQSQMSGYWLPRIIVLLHSPECVDTLVTSTHPDQPLQFNSWSIQDGTLSLFLTESVGKHDRYWATLAEYHFYNGNMQMEPYAYSPVLYENWLIRKDIEIFSDWRKVYPIGKWKNEND